MASIARLENSTLCNQSVEILIVGSFNAQVATAYVIDSLVVDHKAAVRVLESGVSGQDGVVWLNDGGSDLRSRVDAELQFALLAIVHRQTLHQESTKARSGPSTE